MPADPARPTGTLRVKGTSMGGTEHRGSPGEPRKAVTWFGPVVDHAIDALFVQDDHGAIVDVNRQACESLGYAPEDIIGSTPAVFDPGLYRDDAFRRRNQERLEAAVFALSPPVGP